MRLHHLRSRIRPSLIAVAVGWAAATAITLPMQFEKILVSSTGGPGPLLQSLAEGTLVWILWTLAIAAGGWLFGLIPVIAMVPENWLRSHPRRSIAIAAVFGWIVVIASFEVWKLLLPYHTLAVRLFTLYSLLLVVFATVAAAVYLCLIAQGKKVFERA